MYTGRVYTGGVYQRGKLATVRAPGGAKAYPPTFRARTGPGRFTYGPFRFLTL